MSTLGKGSNEITAFHLTKTYCLPFLLYGCEVWHLNDINMQKSMWHGTIALHTFFHFVGGSVKPLQYFCSSLLMSGASYFFGKKRFIGQIIQFYCH